MPELTSPEPEVRKLRRPRLFWSWSRDLLLALAFSAVFIIFLYQPVRVEGTSMLPGLQDQERIFINKFVYKLEPIERGDIVVFHYPFDPSKSYIKRVIGVYGDRIHIVYIIFLLVCFIFFIILGQYTLSFKNYSQDEFILVIYGKNVLYYYILS